MKRKSKTRKGESYEKKNEKSYSTDALRSYGGIFCGVFLREIK